MDMTDQECHGIDKCGGTEDCTHKIDIGDPSLMVSITAVKMEVVLPAQSSTDQLVLNTLKTGEDAMARVKSSHYETMTDHQGGRDIPPSNGDYDTGFRGSLKGEIQEIKQILEV